MDNPVDAGLRRPLPSGIRTGADARVTWSARGSGKPGREPDGPRKTDARPAVRDDRDVGSGAARRTAREPQEACRGPIARAAPDARRGHPEPPTGVRRRARRRPRGAVADPHAGGPVRDRRSRPAPPALDHGHQPDGHPRPGGRRPRPRRRQPQRGPVAARPRARPVRRPRLRRRLSRACRSRPRCRPRRALLVEPIAKKARFLSVVVEATGLAATVEAAPVRAEALAADPRHRGRWPAVTARAVAGLADLVELAVPLLAPGRRARRLEARRDSTTSSPPPNGRSSRWAAGPSTSSRSTCPGWRTTASSS